MVLVFHSAMMNGRLMARFCGLSEKADRSGFVVVYANGTGSTPLFLYWDAGGVRGRVSDDVGYVAKLLDDLATVVNVDPKRVFATGMSNGAMMCYRLAAELSDRIAAIAADRRHDGDRGLSPAQAGAGAPLPRDQGRPGPLRRAGRADPQEPEVPLGRRDDPGLGEANGCPETPVVAALPDLADEGTTVRRKSTARARRTRRWFSTSIEGGGHTWPGQDPRVQFLGKSTRDISANDLMWEFFQKHPMK